MNAQLVSIIYPVYNDSASDIKKSLDSIVNQEYKNLEIVIVDDSTDEASIQAINAFTSDPRIKIIRKNNKAGLAQALNSGIEAATGEYIARADADDIQNLNRIRKQVSFLQKHKDIGIIGANINYVDDSGIFLKERLYPENDASIKEYLHLRNPFCHSVVMIRKSVLDSIGYYNPEFRRAEDYELWFRAAKNHIRFHNLQEVLMSYKVATASKRDELNWKMNLKLKNQYFSLDHFWKSILGIASVYFYLYAPKRIQAFVYNKFS